MKKPKMPNPRSLLAIQSHIATGVFANRHLEALTTSDMEVQTLFMSLLGCVRDAQSFVAANPQKQRQAQTRNLVCVCTAACSEETKAWVQCYRGVARSHKQGVATDANCEELRQRLERCTQDASNKLLHAAVLPPADQHMGMASIEVP